MALHKILLILNLNREKFLELILPAILMKYLEIFKFRYQLLPCNRNGHHPKVL